MAVHQGHQPAGRRHPGGEPPRRVQDRDPPARHGARLLSRHLSAVGAALTVGIVGIEASLALAYFGLVTVLPQVAHALHGDSAFSVAAAASMITSVIGFVVASTWADRSGPRPVLTAGFVCLVLGALVCGAAPTMWVFVGGRLLGGFGTGLVGVATYSLVSHLVAPEHRAWVFGLVNGAWLLPSLIGPLAAGAAAEAVGWRGVFAGVAALMVVSFGVLLLGLRGRRVVVDDEHDARTPWLTGLVASAALFALHIGGARVSPAGIAVSLAALVLTLLSLHRLLPDGTFRGTAGAPRLVALRAILGATMGAADTYVPYYLQTVRGVSMTASGLIMAGGAIGWGIGAMTQSAVARRLEPARFLRLATTVGPVAPLVILGVVLTDAPAWLIAVALAVLGFGLGSAYPQISTLAFELSPQRQHGSIGGALQLGDSAAGGAVLAVTGLILALTGADGLAWVYVVPVLLGALGVLVAARATEAAPAGGA